MKKKYGLYIHIPFCQKKCHYCDFLTFVGHDDKIKKYVEYLKKEIELYASEDSILDTIYIGGGTPSYLDSPITFTTFNFINFILSTYFLFLRLARFSLTGGGVCVVRELSHNYSPQ